jgi:hypothetical protein
MKAPAKRAAPKKSSAPAAVPMTAHDPDMMKYRARDAIDTLKRAEEIKNDPHLMSHVKKHAIEQRNHLTKVIRRTK